MQFASDNSLEPLLLVDSDWLVRLGSDNARISSRISASRSGGLGGVLINVTDAADLKFCLPLLFLLPNARTRLSDGSFPKKEPANASGSSQESIPTNASRNKRIFARVVENCQDFKEP